MASLGRSPAWGAGRNVFHEKLHKRVDFRGEEFPAPASTCMRLHSAMFSEVHVGVFSEEED